MTKLDSEALIISIIVFILRYFVLQLNNLPNTYFIWFVFIFSLSWYYSKDPFKAGIIGGGMVIARFIFRLIFHNSIQGAREDSFHICNNVGFFLAIYLLVVILKSQYIV